MRHGLLLAAALAWAAGVPAADEPPADEPMVAEAEEFAKQAERHARRLRQRQLMELSCRDEQGRPESWLDRTHSYLSERLCEPAAWFDGFFGDPRSFEETPVGSFIRVRNSLRWDQSKDFSFRLRLRANISLPRVSDRIRLLVTRDDDVTGEFDQPTALEDEDDRTRLGLRFLGRDRARSRFDVDATVRVSGTGLNPRVRGRYRVVQGLTDRTLARLTQTAFWERDEGLGTTSRLDWEWLPDRDQLVRWTGQGTFSETSDGVEWRSSVIDFRQLTNRTALRGEFGAFGVTRPSLEVEEYFVAVRYRRQFLRRWLFFELEPERAWPKDLETGERRSDWRFTFTLEVQFENESSRQERLRRYLGEDAEEFEWDPDTPIPVDAPGDRFEDPVLDDEDNGDNDSDNG